jgi:hypothetical protein
MNELTRPLISSGVAAWVRTLIAHGSIAALDVGLTLTGSFRGACIEDLTEQGGGSPAASRLGRPYGRQCDSDIGEKDKCGYSAAEDCYPPLIPSVGATLVVSVAGYG